MLRARLQNSLKMFWLLFPPVVFPTVCYGFPNAFLGLDHSFLRWSTYVITQTSVVIKHTIENKKLAIRCKIWPTMQNLGLNKIEATLDDALMWKKGLWFYNASSSREFSVDEVKLRAEWQVGLRFSRHLLKPGDPRRHQGPFCIEYLALKDAQGEPLIEYHGDRSPRYPLNVSVLHPSTRGT
jgi:hypothetical protein